jgi:hypothetical protein
LRVTRTGTFAVDQNLLGMSQTLLNLVTRRRDLGFATLKTQRPTPSRLATSLAAGLAVVPVAVALEAAASLAGRGGSLIVHAARA